MPKPIASPFAAEVPIISEVASPGPAVAAKASTSGQRHARLASATFEHRAERAEMIARGDFRHDAAVRLVHGDLRGDFAGEQPAIAQDRHRRFIAGSLQREDAASARSGLAGGVDHHAAQGIGGALELRIAKAGELLLFVFAEHFLAPLQEEQPLLLGGKLHPQRRRRRRARG